MECISFLYHYEKKNEKMHLVELEDDYRCKHGVPHFKVRSDILNHVANVYTNKILIFLKEN